MPEAVIVCTGRSLIGRAGKGSLKDMRPDGLAVQMVLAALDKVPELDPAQVVDLVLGVGQPAGESGNHLGRAVAVLTGMDHLPGVVNRYCSSGLQATRMALHAIKAGEGDAYISAGVETVSRFGTGWADDPEAQNPVFARCAGAYRQACGRRCRDLGRPADHRGPARPVHRDGSHGWEHRPDPQHVATGAGRVQRSQSEPGLPADRGRVLGPRDHAGHPARRHRGQRRRRSLPGTTMEAVSQLKPVFRPDGTVTAGNACPLNDGAVALVVMSDVKAEELGLTPLARIVSMAVTALSPEIMGLGTVEAIPAALRNVGMGLADIDLFEINEAFAVQSLGSAQQLGIPLDKLNVNGGAIAIGHPFGMTGARITATLINSLQWHDKQFGVEAMCVGMGMCMCMGMGIERLS